MAFRGACFLSLLGYHASTTGSDVALVARLALALLAIAVLATIFAVKFQVRPARMKRMLGAAYVAISSLLAGLWGRGLESTFLTMGGLRNGSSERYFFIGSCMFIFFLALIIDAWIPLRKPAVLLACLLALGTTRNFHGKPFVDLDWKANAAKIEKWEAARKRHENVEPLQTPINPPHFVMVLDQLALSNIRVLYFSK